MEKDELTYKIIGCAMKVHNTLGNGFQEVIYQRCLSIELEQAGLNFKREKEQAIYYAGINVATRRADFIVEEKVIIELKAIINLQKGLLINFGGTSLQYKLAFNNNTQYNKQSSE